MTNKKSQRNQRGNRKHRTLRGGGWFDGWWLFGKKTDTTMTTNPVAAAPVAAPAPAPAATEPKQALNAEATGPATGPAIKQPGPATGGKRRNKTEKNKNKNRKNKH